MKSMDNNEKPPEIRYPMAAPCGLGHMNEFKNAAHQDPDTRADNSAEAYGFLRYAPYTNPPKRIPLSHEVSHDSVKHAAGIFPRISDMDRITYGPEYQGDMQMECLVLANATMLRDIRERRGNLSEDYTSLEDMKNILRGRCIAFSTGKAIQHAGYKGRFGAAYIGMNSNPPKSMFKVRKEHDFNDDAIFSAATLLAQEKGDKGWKDSIQDGQSYDLPGGLKQTYHTVKEIHPENETFLIMTDRMAHFLYDIQDRIRNAPSEEAAFEGFENWMIREPMLKSNTVPAEYKKDPHFEEQYGL